MITSIRHKMDVSWTFKEDVRWFLVVNEPISYPWQPKMNIYISIVSDITSIAQRYSCDIVISNINEVAVDIITGPFDLYSPVYRHLGYRVLLTHIYLKFSHHSESNDMRQPHVLINGLGNSSPFGFDDVIITYMSFFRAFRPKSRGIQVLNFFNMVIRA